MTIQMIFFDAGYESGGADKMEKRINKWLMENSDRVVDMEFGKSYATFVYELDVPLTTRAPLRAITVRRIRHALREERDQDGRVPTSELSPSRPEET